MDARLATHLQSAALGCLGLSGACANGLVFLLLYRKHSMRTFSNRFVLSLAVSHMMQCLLIIPGLLASSYLPLSPGLSRLLGCANLFLNLASVLSIVLIAVDRNCAVNSPLHYTLTITKKRTGLLISAAWLTALLISLPPLLVPEVTCTTHEATDTVEFGKITTRIVYSVVVCVVGFVAPFSSVACLYFAMFQAARGNYARTTRRSSSYSSGSNEVIVNIKSGKNEDRGGLRRNFSAEHEEPKTSGCCFAGRHKAAVTGLLVVVSFVTCWMPFFVSMMADLYVLLPPSFQFCIRLTTFASCVINPYLYFFRNKNTWLQTKKTLIALVTRRRDIVHRGRTGKKGTVELSSGISQLPEALTQSVLAMNTTHLNSSVVNQSLVHQDSRPPGPTRTSHGRDVFTLDPAKPLLHQDSSSSNDSSEPLSLDTGLASNTESLIWYHPFQTCRGMVDVPLHRSDSSPGLTTGQQLDV